MIWPDQRSGQEVAELTANLGDDLLIGIVLVFAVWVDQLRRRGQNRR